MKNLTKLMAVFSLLTISQSSYPILGEGSDTYTPKNLPQGPSGDLGTKGRGQWHGYGGFGDKSQHMLGTDTASRPPMPGAHGGGIGPSWTWTDHKQSEAKAHAEVNKHNGHASDLETQANITDDKKHKRNLKKAAAAHRKVADAYKKVADAHKNAQETAKVAVPEVASGALQQAPNTSGIATVSRTVGSGGGSW